MKGYLLSCELSHGGRAETEHGDADVGSPHSSVLLQFIDDLLGFIDRNGEPASGGKGKDEFLLLAYSGVIIMTLTTVPYIWRHA